MKNILHVIPTNSSTLDFMFPIFWKHANFGTKKIKFSILCLALNKNAFLKSSEFYFCEAKKLNVEIYDLTDFLPFSNTFKKKIRKFYNFSNYDKILISPPYTYFSQNYTLWLPRFIFYLFKKYSIRDIINTIKVNLLNKLSILIINKNFSFKKVLVDNNISIVSFDNRSDKKFLGAKSFFKEIIDNKIPVILIPHGPHYISPYHEFVPFLDGEKTQPSFIRHWQPYKNKKIPGTKVIRRRQVKYIGYPGYDKDWLEDLKNKVFDKSYIIKNILFIVRRFEDRSDPIFNQEDIYIPDENYLFSIFNDLKEVFKQKNIHPTIIIKPHPKNSISRIKKLFSRTSYDNILVTKEPMYSILPKVQLTLSTYSTSLLLSIVFEVPTVIFFTKSQINDLNRWLEIKKLYTKFSFFIQDSSDFNQILNKAIEDATLNKRILASIDKNHMLQFFDQSGAKRALEELEYDS